MVITTDRHGPRCNARRVRGFDAVRTHTVRETSRRLQTRARLECTKTKEYNATSSRGTTSSPEPDLAMRIAMQFEETNARCFFLIYRSGSRKLCRPRAERNFSRVLPLYAILFKYYSTKQHIRLLSKKYRLVHGLEVHRNRMHRVVNVLTCYVYLVPHSRTQGAVNCIGKERKERKERRERKEII